MFFAYRAPTPLPTSPTFQPTDLPTLLTTDYTFGLYWDETCTTALASQEAAFNGTCEEMFDLRIKTCEAWADDDSICSNMAPNTCFTNAWVQEVIANGFPFYIYVECEVESPEPTHPTPSPTGSSTIETLTMTPTQTPTQMPSTSPTLSPTVIPTETPTPSPTLIPTRYPSIPSIIPTPSPITPTEGVDYTFSIYYDASCSSLFIENEETFSGTCDELLEDQISTCEEEASNASTCENIALNTCFTNDFVAEKAGGVTIYVYFDCTPPTAAPTAPTPSPSATPTAPTPSPSNLPTPFPTNFGDVITDYRFFLYMDASCTVELFSQEETFRGTCDELLAALILDCEDWEGSDDSTCTNVEVNTCFTNDYVKDYMSNGHPFYVYVECVDAPTISPTAADPSPSPTSLPSFPVLDPSPSPTPLPSFPDPSPSPTSSPSVPDCVEHEEWTEERAEALCPGSTSRRYGVGLCDKYDNPDYRKRLDHALANELYTDCDHICLYDYRSYNSSLPHAFKYESSDDCYNVVIGWYCILDEEDAMNQVHLYSSLLCELTGSAEECIEIVEWSQEVSDANCPNGYSGKDKGFGSAEICDEKKRLNSGYFVNMNEYYNESFQDTLANFMYTSCSAKCMYDLRNNEIAYQFKSGCWLPQEKWSCFTSYWRDYEWALEYAEDQLCPFTTPAPTVFECTERILQWHDGIANITCTSDQTGKTDKSASATVCTGYEHYQYRLDRSLANRMFLSCEAWCVYDIFSQGKEAFMWKNNDQCYKPVTGGICISTTKDLNVMTDYVENVLCESHTPEPTVLPTCGPQEEWSEALMDEYCTVDATLQTFKHYASVNRAAVPCEGEEAYEYDLLKSLAMKLFSSCSSWCVYDYNTNAEIAWKWKNSAQCWTRKTWGTCHWDYVNSVNSTEWEDAKKMITQFCTYPPTMSPTNCIPTYEWTQDRAEELCTEDDYGYADKGYGTVVCSDATSSGLQAQLNSTLANGLYKSCGSWCVYDYETVINNIKSGSSDAGGFIWKNIHGCWKWVPASNMCFTTLAEEFESVQVYAEGFCQAQ